MPYTLPTASEFKVRHPAFAAVDNVRIEAVLTEASGFVDNSWIERDYQPAVMYRTAHMLVMEGVLVTGGTWGGTTGVDPGTLVSESIGDASRSYAYPSTGGGGSSGGVLQELQRTQYGRRFLDLLRMNFPAVATTRGYLTGTLGR